jgi:hypothetical protein
VIKEILAHLTVKDLLGVLAHSIDHPFYRTVYPRQFLWTVDIASARHDFSVPVAPPQHTETPLTGPNNMSVANILVSPPTDTERFEQADTDTRLALLWVMAKRLRQISTTTAPAAAFSQVVQSLIRQLHQVQREEQLDVLRDMITGETTRLAEAYGALDANMRLAFWYRLVNSQESYGVAAQVSTMGTAEQLAPALADLNRRDSNELFGLFKTAVATTGTVSA